MTLGIDEVHWGCTGSSTIVTHAQVSMAMKWVAQNAWPTWAHHGDCIYGDVAWHHIFRVTRTVLIGVHPPVNPIKRAWCVGDKNYVEAEYLTRNRMIVDMITPGGWLVAMPEGPEKDRSGTWYTIRYARRSKKPVLIFWPNGHVTVE